MFERVLNTPLDKKYHDQLIILTKTREKFNPLSTNLTKWSNTIKQFAGQIQKKRIRPTKNQKNNQRGGTIIWNWRVCSKFTGEHPC